LNFINPDKMVKYAASILVAAALVAAVHAKDHHSSPRDLTDVELFEREIPFDLGDLSARDDADLYTRDFFETELSERDLELLERAPSLWFQNAIKQYSTQFGPKKSKQSKAKADDADLSERDLTDDSDLLERDFDDSDLLERDFEELEARESIWSKIRNFFTGKKGKKDKQKKAEAEKKKKAAEAKKKAEAEDLAERDYDDEDLFERDVDEELMERELDDELLERDFDEEVFERDIAEEDLYERDFDEEMFERDVEDELLEREFDEESLVEREIDEMD